MDLAGMLNERDAPPKKSLHTSPPLPNRASAPQASPPVQTPSSYTPVQTPYAPPRPGQQQQTPLYGPPSASAGGPLSQSQGRGLTPLHTSSHSASGYPFPQQPPAQSPATVQSAHTPYRGPDPYPASATTPGPRPTSHHGYAQAGPSLGQYQAALNAHHPSHSPTPSSHASQTPQHVRQSPLATPGPPPSHAPSHHYHQSQPNTPLGPPGVPQRQSNQPIDLSSPYTYHQRSYSGASNGILSGSPAQHHPSIGNLVDSPSANAYNRPSPHVRQPSDYRSSVDRERSVSVSPKTIVQPRPSSLGSRSSSQQEVHTARSSMTSGAHVASSADTSFSHVQPSMHHASEVAQAPSRLSGQSSGLTANGNSLSQSDNKAHVQHQSQKMGMNHLLTPTQHAQPPQHTAPNGAPYMTSTSQSPQPRMQSQGPPPASSHSQSQAQQDHVKTDPLKVKHEIQTEPSVPLTSSPLTETAGNLSAAPKVQPVERTAEDMSISAAPAQGKMPLKRPAESEPSSEPSAKRGRVRKYKERPVWAHLSHQNPRAKQPGVIPNSKSVAQGRSQGRSREAHANGVAEQHLNGTAHTRGDQEDVKPWQRDPPLDDDLVKARKLLGRWEKSIKWNVRSPSLNETVYSWLLEQLAKHSNLGLNPHEANLEIEAKIGTLLDENEARCPLPVMNACVVQPAFCKRYHFKSELDIREHKQINDTLNAWVAESCTEKGRERIKYTHFKTVDSFQLLNDAGLSALPEAAHRNRQPRALRLRTSVDQKTGQVTARIVKVKLGDDLHIYGASDPYDVRLSINLEVNLDRPGLDPSTLVEPHTEQRREEPPRQKDRVSYQHLAYQIDLTKVDMPNMDPKLAKFELELEVDANLLRAQHAAFVNQQPSAFFDIVDGFVNNMALLMKVPRSAPAEAVVETPVPTPVTAASKRSK